MYEIYTCMKHTRKNIHVLSKNIFIIGPPVARALKASLGKALSGERALLGKAPPEKGPFLGKDPPGKGPS